MLQTDNGLRVTAILNELIKTLGEVFAVIIAKVHVLFAIAKLFEVRVQTYSDHAVVPGFLFDFYNYSETYLFSDFHFSGEKAFVPIAIVILGTLLALSLLFIGYRCSDFFKE
jgi:hypothetical protein